MRMAACWCWVFPPKSAITCSALTDGGREHRRYVDTLGRQGFYVNQRTQDAADTVHGFVAALPEADSTINRTWVRDGKFAAKPPALRKTEKRTILTHFRMAT